MNQVIANQPISGSGGGSLLASAMKSQKRSLLSAPGAAASARAGS